MWIEAKKQNLLDQSVRVWQDLDDGNSDDEIDPQTAMGLMTPAKGVKVKVTTSEMTGIQKEYEN